MYRLVSSPFLFLQLFVITLGLIYVDVMALVNIEHSFDTSRFHFECGKL
jgi:hypothetical protein